MKSHHRAAPPTVLIFAGNDPSGGAGISADIEVISHFGCQPLPIITALTVQDTTNVDRLEPVSAELVTQQAETILNDVKVDAIKIGLIGSLENLHAIQLILKNNPDIPVVMDTILRAGGGASLSNESFIDRLHDLFPFTTIITPNSDEAQQLVPEAVSLDEVGEALLKAGTQAVLITGTHAHTDNVINTLYTAHTKSSLDWPRLPNSYHGSGCTLASTIAAKIALGEALHQAVNGAQQFTWQSLKQGYKIGHGQHHPNRVHQAADE
ncbi:MAG: hydroxymethylpyrimidine/phosphomethylpyrimidine kinase [Gammaproteobacteria bacterium]|nr:hydroxymethylpyrimidine/phosphomethylpyrimidine kinase [Gammaproteobacteria bacterium]